MSKGFVSFAKKISTLVLSQFADTSFAKSVLAYGGHHTEHVLSVKGSFFRLICMISRISHKNSQFRLRKFRTPRNNVLHRTQNPRKQLYTLRSAKRN